VIINAKGKLKGQACAPSKTDAIFTVFAKNIVSSEPEIKAYA